MPHSAYARQYVIYLTIVCSVPWIVAALIIAMVLVTELVAWASKSFWRVIVALSGWLRWHSLPVPE